MIQSISFVSVIIPVFNDELRLITCLEALASQTYDSDQYEVVVVDNVSQPPISDALIQRFSAFNFIREDRSGSYAARNTGIRASKGNIIAFTDSDCIPDSHWIENGVRALSSSKQCGLVGGEIHTFYQSESSPTIVELYEKHSAFPQKKYIEKNKFSVTANLFTYRIILEEVGYFDEDLRSGGDQEWGKRVYSAGYSLIYAEDVIIRHPARASIQELKQKVVRQTSGLLDIDQIKKGSNQFRYSTYLNWLAYVLPSPRITLSIIRDQEISAGDRMRVLGVSLLVKWMRTQELLQLSYGFKPKQYD